MTIATRVAWVLALVLAHAAALAQPVISSFSRNGELVCTNLLPGTVAVVEWASSVTGPWTNNWAWLDSVAVDSNGTIRVSVPMFYRVRGVTNASPNTNAPANMAIIPAGWFTMGDIFGEGPSNELPTHSVYVSALYMDKYEVTKALWDEVKTWAVANGYSFDNAGSGKGANHPVQTVNWYDAVKWCNARSEKEGRVPAYYTDAAQTAVYRTGQFPVQNDWVKWNAGYRLPTEAEWEKGARGGLSGRRFPWGDTITHSQANYNSSSTYAYDVSATRGYHPNFQSGGEPYTSPVGSFAANGYGLYDMVGNVAEWCWNWSGYYSSVSQTDPRGPTTGVFRRFRGGSWYDYAVDCRTANRYYSYIFGPDYYLNFLGFRSVLPLGQ